MIDKKLTKSEVEVAQIMELTYNNAEIDLPFSACPGKDCPRRNECLRHEIWLKVAQYRTGDTCLVPVVPNCNSFKPKNCSETTDDRCKGILRKKALPRNGWAERCKDMHDAGDDELILDDLIDAELLEELEASEEQTTSGKPNHS